MVSLSGIIVLSTITDMLTLLNAAEGPAEHFLPTTWAVLKVGQRFDTGFFVNGLSVLDPKLPTATEKKVLRWFIES